MNPSKTVGLGEPELVGKKSLFRPPPKTQEQETVNPEKTSLVSDRRVRMTLELTMKSLSIIQDLQGQYRLKTGHPLPKWKIISDALQLYEQTKKGEGSEK